MISRHCKLARRLADQLGKEEGIEILNQVSLNQVVVGFGDDDRCETMIEWLAEENKYLLGGATWHGRRVLRVSVISWFTEEEEIDDLTSDIVRLWRKLKS